MKKKQFAENGRSVSINDVPERAKSWRIMNAFMPTVGSLDRLMAEMPGFKAQHFNALYISPLFTPTKTIGPTGSPAGSCYAMTSARLNPAFTHGRQMDITESIEKVRAVNRAAKDNKLTVFFDCVLNHIGHDCAVFDPKTRHTLYDDPIFGKMARAADAGIIDPNSMFYGVNKKRHPHISGTWQDVREAKLESDDDIDRITEYFVVPYLTTLRDYAIAEDDMDATLNLRFDAVSQPVLPERGWQSGHAWWKFAAAITPICQSRNGRKPDFLLETLGEAPEHYEPVLNSFPPEMKKQLHQFSGSMWMVTGDEGRHLSPLQNMDAISRHKKPLGVHNRNQIAIIGTHDLPFDANIGTNLNSYLNQCFDRASHTSARKLLASALLLGTPSHMVVYGDHDRHTHKQPEFWSTKPLSNDERDMDAVMFMSQLNKTKKRLYRSHESFVWSEMSFSHRHPGHALLLNWPEQQGPNPVVVLVDTTDPGSPDTTDPAHILNDLYGQMADPEAILLLGPHAGLDPVKLAAAYPNSLLIHNGADLRPPAARQVAYKQAPDRGYNTPKVA